MPKQFVTILGKTVRHVARLRGGGSAMPGLIVEKIDPNFIKHTLSSLPMGVAVVSGTNGKTTTTKMIVELLEGQGLKVFTNRTGSNFTRGVAAALLGDININGKLDADIAVLELDEAHAVHFVEKIPPKYCLILNAMRDQLDRFGEIDYTASLLQQVAAATSDTVVLNREDTLISNIAKLLGQQKVVFFGLDKSLLSTFPSDNNLHSDTEKSESNENADVILKKFSDESAVFTIGGNDTETTLKLTGIYNVFNAAAALALVRAIIGNKIDDQKLIQTLANVTPAFGRGETIIVDNMPLELVLVKNPSGFRLGLGSFDPAKYATMIAINDNYADGRDMSWLWDVDFTSLTADGVAEVSGIRAYDMALRLQYDEVPIKNIDTNLDKALKNFIRLSSGQPKRIYCTYTVMLAIRQMLSKITKVKSI